MYQVKIFKGIESNLAGLEQEVNNWLITTNARVAKIFGNLAPQSGERTEANSLAAYPYLASDVLLVVLYEVSAEEAQDLQTRPPESPGVTSPE